MEHDCMLTTIDNPFDPFEQFDSWFLFDIEKGYYSCNVLARIAHFTEDMSQKEIDEENERAIDEIIRLDVTNMFKKATRQATNPTDTVLDA